ncbi:MULTISPECIES: type II toxin-antitoxin system VapB family antitoxin [Synechococcales]|jgi:antitoxin VapB|uniref:type II toxin-antitoxin system VapB family antitoxin n=1 Tax=Synechococcales TaxID=1890424 RepID=UPI000B98BE9F|nr:MULTISPECIES: type II toxin-antitoxin system VapB family antitoxin [Synechococcales]MCP9890225.1 type II toxin-antitoxin system VapB family antitoxin [Cyanobium sp. Aljojuca 7D2]MCP9942743.1 type II toxin-antitoxin system VapB family antitoxin [Cyanobium sp. ATX 6E8]
MALNIRNSEADRLAGEVAALAGETKTAAVIQSLHERLDRLKQQRQQASKGRECLADRLNEIALRAASRPVIDSRSPEEILGYNAIGVSG